VALPVVETAFAPRVVTPLDSPSECAAALPDPLAAYFRPVIHELRVHPAPETYLDYLLCRTERMCCIYGIPNKRQILWFS
jgi:hypothetical protein